MSSACTTFDPKYIDMNHQLILTGDLEIICNAKFKKKKIPKALNTDNMLIHPGKKPEHNVSLV